MTYTVLKQNEAESAHQIKQKRASKRRESPQIKELSESAKENARHFLRGRAQGVCGKLIQIEKRTKKKRGQG